jgi:hypothetical protein
VNGDLRALAGMYHVELRQFPHNFCRFNLTEQELREAILDAWAQGEWVEFGERKWSPHQANLTVLEGPRLPVDQLSMGRGWRNAGRQGQDVTEQLLATARAATAARTGHIDAEVGARAERWSPADPAAAQAPAGAGSALDVRLAADSLGLEALAKLGEEPVPLAVVWRLARERYPERPASDCLKLAERAIESLVHTGLALVLVARDSGVLDPCVSGEEVERALHAIESWSNAEGATSALLRRV